MKKKTHEQFVKEVFDLVGNEYTVLGEYINTRTKIKVQHNKCGHIYEVTPANFLKGSRCPKCFGALRKTTEQFVKEVFNIVGNEYTVLEEYKNNRTKIKVKHNKCGYEYYVTPNSFLRGCRCFKCFGKIKKTTEEFVKEVFELVGNEYEVLGDYKNTNIKIKMKHNKCGNEYYVTPNSFLQGNRCPICKSSKGEEKISKYLIKNNIKFETQKTFDDLKYRDFLRFDFYLPEYNLLIEYDGEQHFKPVRFNGISEEVAEENFKNQQIRDKIKNKYCKENVIKLLRIKYTDFKNIKKILKEGLK